MKQEAKIPDSCVVMSETTGSHRDKCKQTADRLVSFREKRKEKGKCLNRLKPFASKFNTCGHGLRVAV